MIGLTKQSHGLHAIDVIDDCQSVESKAAVGVMVDILEPYRQELMSFCNDFIKLRFPYDT